MRSYTIAAFLSFLFTAGVLTGCTTLVTEELTQSVGETSCRNTAGAYALPKDLLELQIIRNEGNPTFYSISDVQTKRTADSGIYCLDFLASPLSADRMEISRSDKNSLLLARISSEFDDKTIAIANAVVDAATSVVAANRGAFSKLDGTNRQTIAAQFEVDPFDYVAMRKVDNALRELDHCVYIDPTDDPYVPLWQGSLCGPANTTGSKTPYYGLSIIRASAPVGAEAREGVLYRPVLSHKLVVMKKDHSAGGAWKLFETKRIHMTNAAPAFSLEVKRSLFVDRKMQIDFDSGVLKEVKIDKPSEAEALSGLVLRTVQVVVSIPVRALMFGTTETKNREKLIKAQGELIATLREYDASVKKYKAEQALKGGTEQQTARGAFLNADPVGSALDATFAECVNSAAGMERAYEKCQAILDEDGAQ